MNPHVFIHIRLNTQTYELQESNVWNKMTVVNTVGFADQMNKDKSYQSIAGAQFEAQLQGALEMTLRVLWLPPFSYPLVPPLLTTGHSLKTPDLVTTRSLDSKVNIIPVVAKADAISKTEL